MIQSFYAAALGAQQQMERLGVHGNNIANVNTHGFKNEGVSFTAAMYSMVDGIEGNVLPKGSGTIMASTPVNFAIGSFTQTARSLDYAIFSEGFFALEETDGTYSYTRDGSFTVSELDGEFYLADGFGRRVLDENYQPILVTDESAALPVGVFNIQYQDGMLHLDSGRFIIDPEKNGTVTLNENAEVQQGFLEESNTDLANEMARVIEAQRAYGFALSMFRTADEVETSINGLIR